MNFQYGRMTFEWSDLTPEAPNEAAIEVPPRRQGGAGVPRMSASQRQRQSNANNAAVKETLGDSLIALSAK